MEQNIGVNRSFRNFEVILEWSRRPTSLRSPIGTSLQSIPSRKFLLIAEQKNRDEIRAVSAVTEKGDGMKNPVSIFGSWRGFVF
jgi:hypothetical protein